MDEKSGSSSNGLEEPSATNSRIKEIKKLRKLGKSLEKTKPGYSHLEYEMCKGCLVLIDGVTNHEYCNSLKDYQMREKELQESRKRKKMMEDILKDHYELGDTKPNNPEENIDKSSKTDPCPSKQKRVKLKCMKCEFYTHSLESFKAHEAAGHEDPGSSTEQEFFHIPDFSGFDCLLQGSKDRAGYYVTEVSQPASSNHDNLSSTSYLFIPSDTMSQNQQLVSQKDVKIPFTRSEEVYKASFPNSQIKVKWATNREAGEKLVDQKIGFIMTKSRFKIIQSRTNQGKNERLAFCSFVDSDKLKLEQLLFSQTQSLLLTSAPTAQETSPQVELDVHKCPMSDCRFISCSGTFSGIRNHLLKHFKGFIESEAKPRAMLTEREKSNCMSKTGCSVPVLMARGELVHHYGIFHCLIDDLFLEFGINKAKELFTNHFKQNQCPYEDQDFEDEESLLKHLSSTHFFNIILNEVEAMVRFNLTFLEDRGCWANVYKCPFCKKRFTNIADGRNVRDVREMVVHCGTEHGFALYYLLLDDKIDNTRLLLLQSNVKLESESEPLDVKPDITKIKIENILNYDEYQDS